MPANHLRYGNRGRYRCDPDSAETKRRARRIVRWLAVHKSQRYSLPGEK